MAIEDEVNEILKEETAQSKAVASLIEVKDKKDKKELGSDIELKTDLDNNATCVHTQADMLGFFLSDGMDEEHFNNQNILQNLVNLKERKLLSKDRKSRLEIVEVARHPDMTVNQPSEGGGFVKNLFVSRKNRQQLR